MRVLDGFCERRRSRWRVRAMEVGDRPGVKFGMLPRGIYFLAEARRIRRKVASPDPDEEGCSSPRQENRTSVSRVKPSQSAFLKFVKV